MKVNEHVAIVGEKVVLVPYRREHVQKYHEWMSDPEIRELTASEPLSLDEEYDMQQKWQEDEDKLTFIIVSRPDSPFSNTTPQSPGRVEIDSFPMIGDVNLFLKGARGDEDFEAEVEIMIAEPSSRRKGLALSALQLFLAYITSPPSASASPRTPSFPSSNTYTPPIPILPSHLVARVSATNIPSISMFTKLGFDVTKRVEVFNEVEMRSKDAGKEWTVREEEGWAKGVVVEYA